MYNITSSGNSDSFPSSFPTGIFFFFPHLTAVAKTFNIMLNKVPRVEIIAPDLKENKIFQVFTTELPVGLSYLAFIMLSYVPSIFTLRVFVINGC